MRFGLKLVIPFIGLSLLVAPEAHAVRTRTLMLRSAAYGTVAGVGIGVTTYPFAKSVNTILAGAAVGLVMGLAFGAYKVHERNEEEALTLAPGLDPSFDPTLASRMSPLGPRRDHALCADLPIYRF